MQRDRRKRSSLLLQGPARALFSPTSCGGDSELDDASLVLTVEQEQSISLACIEEPDTLEHTLKSSPVSNSSKTCQDRVEATAFPETSYFTVTSGFTEHYSDKQRKLTSGEHPDNSEGTATSVRQFMEIPETKQKSCPKAKTLSLTVLWKTSSTYSSAQLHVSCSSKRIQACEDEK
ncbi:hypothetical protein C0Q70_17491 [Pomacea canaliculata]|uniref:Uncharacterized protein n=1 Tax=Pomacea canaliculata TaxID=400727 RepID=A0A2T7NKK9_POMCA|nr:hypothetical protein C0Q70_17491 [Pomacea canaliculata]